MAAPIAIGYSAIVTPYVYIIVGGPFENGPQAAGNAPNTVRASLKFANSGQLSRFSDNGAGVTSDVNYPGQWSNWGSAAALLNNQYDVRVTNTAGSAPNFGNALATWLPNTFIMGGYEWGYQNAAAGFYSSTNLLEIRSATTLQVLASTTFRILVNVF